MLTAAAVLGWASLAVASTPLYVISSYPTQFGPAFMINGWSSQQSGDTADAKFGTPSKRVVAAPLCTKTWATLGLTLVFVDQSGRAPCDGAMFEGSAGGGVWKTNRNLRLGAPLRELRRLYPSAARAGTTWALVRASTAMAGSYTALGARVAGGRVAGFTFSGGGAGD